VTYHAGIDQGAFAQATVPACRRAFGGKALPWLKESTCAERYVTSRKFYGYLRTVSPMTAVNWCTQKVLLLAARSGFRDVPQLSMN
jgi:hypothetical protein